MISLTHNQKTFFRYLISLNFSVLFGLITAGIINMQVTHFLGYLPTWVFVMAAALGLVITVVYASTFGPMVFNAEAIIIGYMAGVMSALLLSHIEIVPYSIVVPLIISAVLTTGLTFIIRPKIFPGLERLLMVIHIISIFLVAWAILYSLWANWLRPLGLLFAADCFALWSPAVVGACPLTLLEGKVRKAQGQQTELGQNTFVRYYLKKWFRLSISPAASANFPRLIAVILFSWWIVDYMIHRGL